MCFSVNICSFTSCVFRRIFSVPRCITTDWPRLFLYQVVQQRGLPFEVKIPNAETIAAIEELETGKGIRVNSVEELFDDAE